MGLRERIEARREGREPRIDRGPVVAVQEKDPRPEWVRRMKDDGKIPQGIGVPPLP